MYLGESFDIFDKSSFFGMNSFVYVFYIPGDQGDCILGRYSRLWGDVDNNNMQVINIYNKMSLDDVCCDSDELS